MTSLKHLLLALLLLPILLLEPPLALAGGARVPVPGNEAWSAPFAAFEPPGSCESCAGVRAFAVRDGVGWFLLHQQVVSTRGERISLPAPGIDLAAGPEALWVLTLEGRGRLERGEYVEAERQGLGPPVQIAGDGTTRTLETVGEESPVAPGQSPWGGGDLVISPLPDGAWELYWKETRHLLPIVLGHRIVDVAAAGSLPDGRVVLSLIDSLDGSAPTGVRFLAVGDAGLLGLASGLPNGDLNLSMRRSYAVDPVKGGIYTLMVQGDRLSLRRYTARKR